MHFLLAIFGFGQTALIFFLVLSVLVLIHEAGHFFVAKWQGIFVEEFGLGLPPRAWGKKFGETLYSLNWLPFGGFVKLLGEETHELGSKKLDATLKNRTFVSKSPLGRALVIVAGVTMNFLLGWFLISIVIFNVGVSKPLGFVRVEGVQENSPASIIGVQKNDKIVAIKDLVTNTEYKITSTEDMIASTGKSAGHNILLTLSRNSQILELITTPRVSPPAGQGALGVNIVSYSQEKLPIWSVPIESFKQSVFISVTIFREFGKMLIKLVSGGGVNGNIAGPIKIAQLSAEAASRGIIDVLNFMALLSLNLAVVNILPFPALDGGRLVFVLYEMVTRKKPNAKFEQKVNLIGFLFLLSLILLVTGMDIFNLFK